MPELSEKRGIKHLESSWMTEIKNKKREERIESILSFHFSEVKRMSVTIRPLQKDPSSVIHLTPLSDPRNVPNKACLKLFSLTLSCQILKSNKREEGVLSERSRRDVLPGGPVMPIHRDRPVHPSYRSRQSFAREAIKGWSSSICKDTKYTKRS